MFADDILKRQKQVVKKQQEEAEKRRKDEEEANLRVATDYIEKVKSALLSLANQGDRLKVTHENTRGLNVFEYLRKIGWKEGISVVHGEGNGRDLFKPTKITFEILDFTVGDSFRKMCINETYLNDKENIYLDKEQEYSIRLSDQENFSSIQEEIVKDKEHDPILFMNALLNAAYRNGMEGEISEVFPNMKEIKPTIFDFIQKNHASLETIENYMHILHNYSKEKEKQNQITKKAN